MKTLDETKDAHEQLVQEVYRATYGHRTSDFLVRNDRLTAMRKLTDDQLRERLEKKVKPGLSVDERIIASITMTAAISAVWSQGNLTYDQRKGLEKEIRELCEERIDELDNELVESRKGALKDNPIH